MSGVSWPVLERFEHAGLVVELGVEEDGRCFDPRDAECNLGTMVCWHSDYVLGDFQVRDGDGRGAVSAVFPPDERGRGVRSMRHLERYLELVERAVVVLPLYLLDHSGVSMSCGSNTVGRGDTAMPGNQRDAWGNPFGWDTTMVGFIYTTAERIAELCGRPVREGDRVYAPRDTPAEQSAESWIAAQLRDEVDVYDEWLRGNVYWYSVETRDGELLDSCGGFLGGGVDGDGEPLDGFDYCRLEACQAAESEAAELALDEEPNLEAAVFAASRA